MVDGSSNLEGPALDDFMRSGDEESYRRRENGFSDRDPGQGFDQGTQQVLDMERRTGHVEKIRRELAALLLPPDRQD